MPASLYQKVGPRTWRRRKSRKRRHFFMDTSLPSREKKSDRSRRTGSRLHTATTIGRRRLPNDLALQGRGVVGGRAGATLDRSTYMNSEDVRVYSRGEFPSAIGWKPHGKMREALHLAGVGELMTMIPGPPWTCWRAVSGAFPFPADGRGTSLYGTGERSGLGTPGLP